MNDELTKIEATSITPSFQLDLKAGTMELKGRSSSNVSQSFYRPVLGKIEHAFTEGVKSWTASFALEYFNTSSAKCLFDILRRLAFHKKNGADITINWIYEECDEAMRESGEDYADILGLSFNYIAIK